MRRGVQIEQLGQPQPDQDLDLLGRRLGHARLQDAVDPALAPEDGHGQGADEAAVAGLERQHRRRGQRLVKPPAVMQGLGRHGQRRPAGLEAAVGGLGSTGLAGRRARHGRYIGQIIPARNAQALRRGAGAPRCRP